MQTATINHDKYYRDLAQTSEDMAFKTRTAAGRLLTLSPILWVLFFAALTGIVNVLAK
jgi:hypothetical protein